MRTVVLTDEGVLEVAWMWLPTWLGMNTHIKKDLEQELRTALVGRVVDEALLEEAHQLVVDYLEKRFSFIEGLRSHLEGLKQVSYR